MPRITFKAKVHQIYNPDETPAYKIVNVPAITRAHCDMAAFRKHPKFGSYANSDLFLSLVNRALKTAGIRQHLRLDALPSNVDVNTSAFLAIVTINID